MKCFNILLYIFVYVTVLCPYYVFCKHGGMAHYDKYQDHTHVLERKTNEPCKTCPRQGRCVPKVQCPAHVRPGANNPACHLDGTGVLGICCFTGSRHAAEHDTKYRSTSQTSPEDVKAAHSLSRKKLDKLMHVVQRLLESQNAIVNSSAPTFGHHLSTHTYDERANKLGLGGLLNLFTAQELKSRQAITDDELELGFTEHTDGPYCVAPLQCANTPSRYRSLGGECNNLAFPTWGAVHAGYERLLPPDYSDSTWSMRLSISGLPLTSARVISHNVLLDTHHPSETHNLMFMQFGQFVAHDVSSGVMFNIGEGSGISCCTDEGQFLPPDLLHWACSPVMMEPEDPFFGNFQHTCLNFVRTQISPNPDCSVGYARQMNGVTHYPDLSHIYGSSEERLIDLRGPGGYLKTFNDYGRELPPLTKRKECLSVNDGAACFNSGDSHGNQIISLTALHVLWTREHNRVARILSSLTPELDDDMIFYETRRILQAEFQHIIYNEWLPMLLGLELAHTFGLAPSPGYSSTYDPHINPSLTAEFATSAMRFGHSIVDGRVMIPSAHTGSVYETLSIPEVMFQPSRLRLRQFLDRILIGMTWQPMQTVDPFVTEGLTRYMFHGGKPYGLDLASINIQRGRDYGVRSYNHYRKLVGLEPIVDFKQLSPSAAHRLSTVYASPEDVDLWIGGLMEEPIDGGITGTTFAHIIADQFARLKKGDRYFYEYGQDINPGAFTPGQLAEIKKVTMSRLICDNRDGFELLNQPPNAFLRADYTGNEPVPCDSLRIPSMDLSRFV